MKYEDWKKKPTRFVAMTGITQDVFSEILPYFEYAHDFYFQRFDIKGKAVERVRRFKIYKNSPLPTIEERLVFILSYLKLNPIQEQHADLFSMTQKQCNEFVHSLHAVLEMTLKNAEMMPARNQQELLQKLEEIYADEASEKKLMHDGTEREVPRPADYELQKEFYSGKKKKHTVKNAVITNMLCFIIFVGSTVLGKVHDKKIADDQYLIPPNFELWQDTGYQGYCPSDVTIQQPIKKTKGKELSEEEKEYNKSISSVRVRVEHAIGSVKRMKIVRNECRLRKGNFVNRIFHTCAGLHNFRLSIKSFEY